MVVTLELAETATDTVLLPVHHGQWLVVLMNHVAVDLIYSLSESQQHALIYEFSTKLTTFKNNENQYYLGLLFSSKACFDVMSLLSAL